MEFVREMMQYMQKHVILIIMGDFQGIRPQIGVNPAELRCMKWISLNGLEDKVGLITGNQMRLCAGSRIPRRPKPFPIGTYLI
jgi:hypothetical protein